MRKFIVIGDKPYCMVHYAKKEIHCVYDTIEDCQDNFYHYVLHEAVTCFPNKYSK
jgi:hypothetical protein